MPIKTFQVEVTVALGFGCALYDWQFPLLYDYEKREVFKFVTAEGNQCSHGALFLEHLGIDFREYRSGPYHLVCECVYDEDHYGTAELYFNLISFTGVK